MWGAYCAKVCICNATNTQSCNPRDGTCNCQPGYWGGSCDMPCPTGTFGLQCRGISLFRDLYYHTTAICNMYFCKMAGNIFRFTLLLSFGCLVISAYCHLASELLTLMNVHTLIILFTEVIFTNRAVSNLDVQRTVELTFL